MKDMVGIIAHELTSDVGGVCCHKTGGLGKDPACECRQRAKDILKSMRIPTEGMELAGDDHADRGAVVWIAMIDAALKEADQ